MARTASRTKAVAYHEAGHAAAALDLNLPFRRVTIVPGEGSSGHILRKDPPKWFDPYGLETPRMRDWVEREIICSFAGPIAQRKASRGGRWDHFGAGSDYAAAVDYGSLLYSGELLEKYLEFVRARAEGLICGPLLWPNVEAIASALLERQTLTRREVVEVVRAVIFPGRYPVVSQPAPEVDR